MSSRALRWNREALVLAFAGLCVGAAFVMRATPARAWSTYAGNSQHTAVSATAAQPFGTLHWVTPVDLAPPTGEIYIHYGSPLVTPANTVVIPIKTGSAGGYRVDARSGADGSLLWSQSTDYILPPHNWTPSYSPALTSTNRLYFAGAGGTVYFRDDVDSGGPASTGQLAFYGMENYVANPASYNSTVFVNTPITADSAGNIYFGFRVSGTAPLGLQSGIARIDSNGNGTWSAAVDASGGDPNITRVPHQAAPALSNDEQTLYVSIASNSTNSYLVGLDPTTLVLKESSPGVKVRVALKDPRNGGVNNAQVSDDSSASPMVGPDGDVYYGVLGNPFNGSRGWMLHFSADLTQTKAPGAFGWDSTPSVVAAAAVPSYAGTSSYLIFTKYNNYAGYDGGDGVNKIAVLDPNDTMTEPHASSNGQLVMKVVLSIAGPTPDPDYVAQFPNAVREWCINSGAVDPLTGSVIANSEDGNVYRWDLSTNTLSEAITLSPGVGEAYTPTVIGPDGTVYAINWAILNAVGSLPTATPTNTPTETPTETVTNTPTSTPTPTPTGTIAPTDTPTDTPTVTPTAAPTDTPTNTPTPTATVSLHDSVVLPRPPLTVHLRRAAPVVKTIRITVVNADILPIAETPGHTITLIASDGDCPLGTVSGSPHFISRAGDLGDSILLAGGKSATAKVTLNISASAFTSFNHRTPTRCTLQFSVTSSGNSDPVPGNNTIPVELNVIDHTDPEQTAVHENFVNSLLPLTLTILDGKPSATKTRRPVVSNADILPIAENPGDSLTVTGSDGTCPAGTLGLLDMDRTMAGAQNAVTVKGGRAATGTLQVTASSTVVTTTNEKSPTRCIATVTVAGPGGDTDGTNNTTKLVIDVYDKNDF